ncbi:glucosamine--fructose-6-phosphate aminotransferase (isomerizing) [Catalinimonas alkaloidigena]|uniref:glutamine--fructose-6-phosphate transaminase (isomerizing) n=1 Tax=Catalinimonas alkaloidigena TaxID=1075417 RepID=UPI0024073C74|nr:glutamine--fructose-6-phosphate transaminase (isomerizing) [Catalinimonas alkaloidigena]MDF9799530.1 glucosamine--fructose-6-phosphate aminotransferase (isomerizing) [Catalinimonas alkaloidigena]
MCGIVAYIGHRQAHEVVIKGLKRLEYRGYDSAGIALNNGSLSIYKKKGKVSELEGHLNNELPEELLNSHVGMGHTRWATHGVPNDVNAHPHYSGNSKLAIIHNGIIENYDALKKELLQKGHTFKSETDTEVLIHFIEDVKQHNGFTLEEAVRIALKRVVGAYAIVIMSADEPETLIAARKGSPLVLGLGKDEFFFASDATPIVEYANEVVYLNDDEVCVVQAGKFHIKDLNDVPSDPYIQTIDIELEAIEKGGFDYFMLKEIHEQPKSISDCLRGRLNAETGTLMMGGIRDYIDELVNAKRIVIVACGTSWHAGLVAEYILEDLCRIPVEVEYASEFRYRNPVINPGDIVIAISQSGETADTLAAVELAKSKGATVLGVCNAVGSSIARASHAGSYTHAGPEIGVASTKAFTAQLTVLTMFALLIGKSKGTLKEDAYHNLLKEMSQIPQKVEKALTLNEQVEYISQVYKDAPNAIYLGRGHNFPVALEGALKLKEISYIHAEGYPAAEMKHGPIALIDEEMPVIFIATQDGSYEKIVSNIQEVKARKGQVIAIVTEGDTQIAEMADYVLEVPKADQQLMPLISVIPLQLLSYHIAVLRGCNVDQPRNLAKSVTVE